MDTVILAASLISFFALVGSWLALPHASGTTMGYHLNPAG